MPITRSGSGTGSRARSSRRSSITGRGSSRACPISSCPRIGPDHRSRASAAANGRRPCRRPPSKPCEHSVDSEGATLYMTLLAAFQVLLLPLLGAGGYRRRHADRRTNSPRAGGPDRVFRQHARRARRPIGRPGVPRVAPPGPPDGDRGLHPSGPPVREAGDASPIAIATPAARRCSR